MTFDEWITEQPAGISACDSFTFGRKVWEAATVKESLMVQVTEVLQAQEPESCPYCDGSGDVHSRDGEWRGECNCGAAQYNMIDRLLRNTFDDEDYAVYSAALDVVASPQPPAPCSETETEVRYLKAVTQMDAAEIAELKAKVARLESELADALDVKDGHGPTALSMVIADRDELREKVVGFADECRRLQAGWDSAMAQAMANGRKVHELRAKVAELKEKMFSESEAFVHFMQIDHPKALGERDTIIAQQSALIERCRDALSMPCDRWNKQQSLIVNDVLEAIAAHKKGGSE